MDFKSAYPDFVAIESHIRRAHAERSLYLAHVIADLILAAVRGVKSLARNVGGGLARERDRLAIEADPFLKRSVPKY